MTTIQRRTVNQLLQFGGAVTVMWIRGAPRRTRWESGLCAAAFALMLANAVDGTRGTTELLRGAAWALQELT